MKIGMGMKRILVEQGSHPSRLLHCNMSMSSSANRAELIPIKDMWVEGRG